VAILAATLATLAACTSGSSATPTSPTPDPSSAPATTPSTVTPSPSPTVTTTPKATPSTDPDVRGLEEIVALPDLGSVGWNCKGSADDPVPTLSTTFTATGATLTAEYSLDGRAGRSRTLQPGQYLSTPFTNSRRHVWTIKQPIDPYNTTATITVTMRPDQVFGCFNPTVTVSRVRVSNASN
jgi:hypothetical protein